MSRVLANVAIAVGALVILGGLFLGWARMFFIGMWGYGHPLEDFAAWGWISLVGLPLVAGGIWLHRRSRPSTSN